MSTRGEDLARQFERENEAFMGFVANLTPAQWAAECAGEGWSVAVTAHHIAEDHGVLGDLVNAIANGQTVPEITADFVNGLNADHAQRAIECTPENVVQMARERGAQVAHMFRSLSDEQLERTGVMPVAGGEVSAAVISELLVIGHIGMHRSSIERAISAPSD